MQAGCLHVQSADALCRPSGRGMLLVQQCELVLRLLVVPPHEAGCTV